MIRVGRFISLPDIEAQLAPNNYTYAHSMTYSWDNYTNTGIQINSAVTKNWIAQLGVTVGTEAMPWHWGAHIPQPVPNVLYPTTTMLKDPGAQPSVTAGLRWTSDDGRDDLNMTADAWNSGIFGYNNLQWAGFTYYHKFNDYWHIAFETYNLHEQAPNLNNAIVNAGVVTPFGGAPGQFFQNGPNSAVCSGSNFFKGGAAIVDPTAIKPTCTAMSQTFLLYTNYSPDKLNNFSLRTEFYMDPQGQRTGVPTNYTEAALSWQHWFSPQIETRPEIGYYRSLNGPAFNGNVNEGIAPTKDWAIVAASDIIIHF
jgi:hypothetical protein